MVEIFSVILSKRIWPADLLGLDVKSMGFLLSSYISKKIVESYIIADKSSKLLRCHSNKYLWCGQQMNVCSVVSRMNSCDVVSKWMSAVLSPKWISVVRSVNECLQCCQPNEYLWCGQQINRNDVLTPINILMWTTSERSLRYQPNEYLWCDQQMNACSVVSRINICGVVNQWIFTVLSPEWIPLVWSANEWPQRCQ